MTESQILKSCLDLLESLRRAGYPIVATRTNAGKVRTDHGRWIDLCRPGWPDITAIIAGRAVGIETKSRKGKQDDGQVEMQAQWEAAGGDYLLVSEIRVLRGYLQSTLQREITDLKAERRARGLKAKSID